MDRAGFEPALIPLQDSGSTARWFLRSPTCPFVDGEIRTPSDQDLGLARLPLRHVDIHLSGRRDSNSFLLRFKLSASSSWATPGSFGGQRPYTAVQQSHWLSMLANDKRCYKQEQDRYE